MSSKSYRQNRERKKAGGEQSKMLEEKDVKAGEARAGSPGTEEEKIITIEHDSSADDDEEDGGDVINIEQMELEKERQARESLDHYLAEVRKKIDWKEGLKTANIEASNNRSDDDRQFYK